MKKLLKALTVALAASALIGTLLSVAYTQTVSKELTRLRRESRSDIVYLRNRVKELEGDMLSSFLDCWADVLDTQVGGEADTAPSEPQEETDVQPDGEADTDADEEAVTIPTHNSPETQAPTEDTTESKETEPSEDADTEAPVAAYLVTVHEGIIGVFDASGDLVRTVNVFVMTLPEAEKEALSVGIPAYSEEEMLAILDRYQ